MEFFFFFFLFSCYITKESESIDRLLIIVEGRSEPGRTSYNKTAYVRCAGQLTIVRNNNFNIDNGKGGEGKGV